MPMLDDPAAPAAMPPMADDELLAAVGYLLALLDGLPLGMRRCACGRPYRLSVTHGLQATAQDIARELHRRGAKIPPAVLSRFQLLELD
jgi:hypothetical protein